MKLFKTLFLLTLLLISRSSFSGWNLYTFDGRPVKFGDRPLLITTLGGTRVLNKDPIIMDDVNAIGFLDYAGIFPEDFSTANALTSEVLSMQSTQRFLTYFKRSGLPLDFNGRVIIKAHGNASGQVGFAYGETEVDLDNPTMAGRVQFDIYDVAVKLRTFFKAFKIPVKQIELYICCEDSTKIFDRFYEGFQAGFEHLKVIGFKTKVGLTRRGR